MHAKMKWQRVVRERGLLLFGGARRRRYANKTRYDLSELFVGRANCWQGRQMHCAPH